MDSSISFYSREKSSGEGARLLLYEEKAMKEEDLISSNIENFPAVVLEEMPREEEQHDQNKKVADF